MIRKVLPLIFCAAVGCSVGEGGDSVSTGPSELGGVTGKDDASCEESLAVLLTEGLCACTGQTGEEGNVTVIFLEPAEEADIVVLDSADIEGECAALGEDWKSVPLTDDALTSLVPGCADWCAPDQGKPNPG